MTPMSDERPMETDMIGGFPYSSPCCKGCGSVLTLENAWMADGCPCNTALGVNSMNETRWRLLMQLQQQSRDYHSLRDLPPEVAAAMERITNPNLRQLHEDQWKVVQHFTTLFTKGNQP